MSIFTLAFWKAAGERAIKSAVQGAVLAGVGAAGFNAFDADWRSIGGGALGMALLSLCTSVVSDALTGGTGPSLASVETLSSTVAAQVTPKGELVAGPAAAVIDGLPVAVIATRGLG